jgi:hypothetical protein
MNKGQRRRVQSLSPNAHAALAAINRVGQQGVADVSQMNPDLVGAPGVQRNAAAKSPWASTSKSVLASFPCATTAMRMREAGSRPMGASTVNAVCLNSPCASAR